MTGKRCSQPDTELRTRRKRPIPSGFISIFSNCASICKHWQIQNSKDVHRIFGFAHFCGAFLISMCLLDFFNDFVQHQSFPRSFFMILLQNSKHAAEFNGFDQRQQQNPNISWCFLGFYQKIKKTVNMFFWSSVIFVNVLCKSVIRFKPERNSANITQDLSWVDTVRDLLFCFL